MFEEDDTYKENYKRLTKIAEENGGYCFCKLLFKGGGQ